MSNVAEIYTASPPKAPKLLEQLRHAIRVRHYSLATEKQLFSGCGALCISTVYATRLI